MEDVGSFGGRSCVPYDKYHKHRRVAFASPTESTGLTSDIFVSKTNTSRFEGVRRNARGRSNPGLTLCRLSSDIVHTLLSSH